MSGQGVMVGPYRLVERVGARGALETYRAVGDDGEVRVDRIDPRFTARRQDVERITEAVQRASRIQHPNVGVIRALLRAHDAHYLVRGHVEGRTLASVLELPGLRWPTWLSLHIASEILSGLAVIHAHDVAHGAIGADVITLTDEGTVVVDGAIVWAALDPNLPTFAPEGVRSAQADLFAVGEVTYRLLTGRRPFPNTSLAAMRAAMRGMSRVAPSVFTPALTPAIDSWVLDLIAAEPEHRPHTAMHAISELIAAADEPETARTPDQARAALLAMMPSVPPPPSRRSLPVRRWSSHVGRAVPVGSPSFQPVPLVAPHEVQWDPLTREFQQTFTPPRPSLPLPLEADALLLVARADGQIERATHYPELIQIWRTPGPRPRLVALARTRWLEADRFAALAGIDPTSDETAPLSDVTHVGDLARNSLIATLAELGRARATGRLMVMDPAEPRSSRRVVTLSEGHIVSIASNHPAHTTADILLRTGHVVAAELSSLFREILRDETSLIDLVAARRRVDPARLRAQVWTERLADPLCQRRGRYAFDAAPLPGGLPDASCDVTTLLVDAARRAKTPEELRQWAAAHRGAPYAVAQHFAPWTARLLLDPRLEALSRQLARHGTIDDTIRRQPGDAGAIMLLAYLFHETRALVFRSTVSVPARPRSVGPP